MLISNDSRLSFEKSRPGRRGALLPKDRLTSSVLPEKLRRKEPLAFPEISEPEAMRHFVNLSRKNFSIDTHFYPLGSCTMKYNPKVNEWAARHRKFASLHPLQPASTVQGMLQSMWDLEQGLMTIAGMDRFTLQPAAGAHGELTGLMLVHAYHKARGDNHRRKVLVPDSSHGTNPATAALVGYEVVQMKSNERGRLSVDELEKHLDDQVACLMLTNPNTLGLFEEDILEVAKRVHAKGGLLYYDGANLNALLGLARPGDMGFDIVHINLHKTFSTPHGGGGPGSGPVGVKKHLIPFLPYPLVDKKDGHYFLTEKAPQSIGRVKAFHGNAGTLLRAFVYLRSLGLEGIKKTGRDAVLNANYVRVKLREAFKPAVDEPCMHEFVLTLKPEQAAQHLHASDIGKRLLDYGFHAPTVHFPLVVPDAIMIEPTESESLEAMKEIADEIKHEPEKIKHAPHNLPIRRPNEVLAARKPVLTYRDYLRESAAPEPVILAK
jgi:glycine dehydrogenase subunit 2